MNVVLDANIAIAMIVPGPYSPAARRQFLAWHESADNLFVPSLWGYEVLSGLRKAICAKAIAPAVAMAGLQELLNLQIELVAPTLALYQGALVWAERLGQLVAYDASYLALAERLEAPFWTADRRLAHRCEQLGTSWVHYLESS